MLNWIMSGLFVLVCWGMQWTSSPVFPSDTSAQQPLSVCDLEVDAGPDTNVCAPGGTIGLMGSISGNPLFYQWSPSTGLNNPFILTPTANITGEITYTLMAWGVDPANANLVVNGNFSGGNVGFNSDYTYVVDIPAVQNEMVPEGTYAIITNPNFVHNGFSGCNDHTGGGGNMMVINGAANLQDIWCQTITVSPDAFYNVSAWVASVNPSSPAQLQFSINGTPIGPIINAVPTPCQWIPFNATWNSGSSTTAEICILNLNTSPGGNDFALDDISMVGLCNAQDEVTITLYDEVAPYPVIDGPTFLCEGETGTYTATFPADPPIYSYQWSVPSGATIVSGQGTPEVIIRWNDAQEGEICLEIETRCDMNEGCFEVTVGTLPEFPLISGPTSLCPGETATFYTPELDPGDAFEWIIPAELVIISGEGTNEIEVEWAMEGEAEICVEVTNACGTTDNCTIMTLWPGYLTLFDTVICEGSTIKINGTIYGNGLLTGVETFTSIGGCDSIVEIEITEATTLVFMVTNNLCPGDSIYLEGAYQFNEGIYTDSFTTASGCDSLVITEVIISPFDTTWIFSTTCNPADTGTTIITINQGNCDSTVITQVLLVPTDTTLINLSSCAPADTGLVAQMLVNQFGCDSLVLTFTQLLPTDTTQLFQSTCDPSGVGITEQLLTNSFGCDSLVITTVAFLQSDTTLITILTCFIADTGTTSALFTNAMGCDSLVITITSYAGSDTTFLTGTTCTASEAGLATQNLLNQFGCDSIIETFITLLPSDTTYLTASSCTPQDTGTFIQHFTNNVGCDSMVILTTTLDPIHLCAIDANTSFIQPLCYGDSGILTISAIVGLEPFTVEWRHSLLPVSGTALITASPGQVTIDLTVGGLYYVDIISANGLSLSDTFLMEDILPLLVTATTQTDAFGYQIACAGDSTGFAMAIIESPGTPPYQYSWSDGSVTSQINQRSSGQYTVTVTDNHGCVSSASVLLTEPLPLQYSLIVEDIDCFGLENGRVGISSIQGGVQPWSTALDADSFQPVLVYDALSAGSHTIVISDQQGCTQEDQFTIVEPENWSIDLGPDTIVAFGKPYTLTAALVGVPYGNLQTNWSDGECDDCLSRNVIPERTTIYGITAVDENGCTHTDEIRMDIFIDRALYVPNVFSPNGDQVNDYFTISAGSGLREIEEMAIYDRWGNLVFQASHFQPDDTAFAWDGTQRGQMLNPGVYVYTLKAIFQDDLIIAMSGDITLIR